MWVYRKAEVFRDSTQLAAFQDSLLEQQAAGLQPPDQIIVFFSGSLRSFGRSLRRIVTAQRRLFGRKLFLSPFRRQ